MAIQFARIEIVGRSRGGNACCKGAYNARKIIKDEHTGVTYNFVSKGDNVYHAVLLPDYVDQKFKNAEVLMNAVEGSEKRKDSQLLKDVVLALPDDKELSMENRIEITHRLITKRGWVREGLAVQVDIHQPHDGEKNWHAHLLVTTRRFSREDGVSFGLKATDLNPEFRKIGSKAYAVPEEEQIHEELRNIINDYFRELGLTNRVDAIGAIAQEHIGPVRMRKVLNQAVMRNEEKRLANISMLVSGKDLVDRVIKGVNVFGEQDLHRAVKHIPDKVKALELVNEAKESSDIVKLYHEDGMWTGLFTTKEVRKEELKLLRLAGYVAKGGNSIIKDVRTRVMIEEAFEHLQLVSGNAGVASDVSSNTNTIITDITDITDTRKALSQEQIEALKHLLFAESGIRIMRGRAGTGKSRVLGELAGIAKEAGIEIVGLAPTHKARSSLGALGFEANETVKGMLFKFCNGKFTLPKGSLIVVDEAGMVGNDDYLEFLRVAASRKCNVILAGDERQLASVQRGGMFEVFTSSFGSCSIVDIQRQSVDWGREVAMAFASGDTRGGIEILCINERINETKDKVNSMTRLLEDWSRSGFALQDKLIITVKNKDVDALNVGAREHLKAQGILTGKEYEITTTDQFGDKSRTCFMQGDRIVIKETNLELGFKNGDFGFVTSVKRGDFGVSFTIKLDNGYEREFSTREYSGFKHGYASTVYKAQGASIADVYLLHAGFSNMRSSYVAMSRHIKELKLYINEQSTRNLDHLARQLSFNPEMGSSLNYLTKEELDKKLEQDKQLENQGLAWKLSAQLISRAKTKITTLVDKYIPNSRYYVFEKPLMTNAEVQEVLEQFEHVNHYEAEYEYKMEYAQIKAVVGENMAASLTSNHQKTSTRSRTTAKEKFYAKVDFAQRRASKQAQWDKEHQALQHEVRFKTEQIVRDLLDAPNKKLSNGNILRYGKRGSLAVQINGNKAGRWYDFETGKGGDIFKLVQEKRNCDFKEAAEYLRGVVGIQPEIASDWSNLKLVYDHTLQDKYTDHIQSLAQKQQEEQAKLQKAEKLYSRAKEIGESSIAKLYLKQVRGISCNLSSDIKTAGIYYHEAVETKAAGQQAEQSLAPDKGKYYPAIIAFARNREGKITGGQQILLDKKTASKASIEVPKRSFGIISGSFVEVTSNSSITSDKTDRITIIAEGLETALSIKQALGKKNVKILCSLGISNIKNYQPNKCEKIIIAADNDGKDSITSKTVEHGCLELSKVGYVQVVTPEKTGDFNDILREYGALKGERKIQEIFFPVIAKHSARTVAEFFKSESKGNSAPVTLEENIKADLAYLQEYGMSEEKIVDAFRKGHLQGVLELEETRKKLMFAESYVNGEGATILKEAEEFGAKLGKMEIKSLINDLTGKGEQEIEQHLWKLRDEYYISSNIKNFAKEKSKAGTPQEVLALISKEHKFFLYLSNNLRGKSYSNNNDDGNDKSLLKSINQAQKNEKNNVIEQLNKITDLHLRHNITKPEELTKVLKNVAGLTGVVATSKSLVTSYQKYVINELQKCLSGIQQGHTVNMSGQKFNCQRKFLANVLEIHAQNEFLPKETIQKAHSKLIEYQKQKDHSIGGMIL